MTALGWDACDIVLVTGDAYVDHPSFGMAIIGRLLEAQGFRVGIIAQPDWQSAEPFKALGKPRLFFGVTGGNMDSMVNRYTADRRLRHDDAYTPAGEGGRRPDRCTIVYAQRCREAFKDVPIVLGGIEASLRRIAHYDYWSDKVRRSVLADAKADLLVYGNAERAIVEVAQRLAAGELVYTGLVRGFVMATADRAPVAGAWTALVNENFATMADVHRILGTLPTGVDLMPTADGRDKSVSASRARLARMVGSDAVDADDKAWDLVARWFAEAQRRAIADAAMLVMSRCIAASAGPVIAAGIGVGVVAEVAQRLGLSCQRFDALLDVVPEARDTVCHCAPAAALTALAS